MNSQLQLRVQRYGWDRAEPYYENGWRNFLRPAQDLLIHMAQIKEGEKILDISSGTGIVSFDAAKLVKSKGQVLGIDISDEMVKSAIRKAKCHQLENVVFRQMEAEQLDFRDNCFNASLNAFGLMYFPDPARAINEMVRVLAPGGRSVSAVWGARNKCGWSKIFPIIDARVKTDVCPLFYQLGTGNALANLYKQNELDNVKTIRINTLTHYRTGEEAIKAVFAGGPVAMAYSKFDNKTKISAHEEYLDSISEFRKGESYYIPGEFVVVGGIKRK